MDIDDIVSGLEEINKLLRPLCSTDAEYFTACKVLSDACDILYEVDDKGQELTRVLNSPLETVLNNLIDARIKEAVDEHERRYHDRSYYSD